MGYFVLRVESYYLSETKRGRWSLIGVPGTPLLRASMREETGITSIRVFLVFVTLVGAVVMF